MESDGKLVISWGEFYPGKSAIFLIPVHICVPLEKSNHRTDPASTTLAC